MFFSDFCSLRALWSRARVPVCADMVDHGVRIAFECCKVLTGFLEGILAVFHVALQLVYDGKRRRFGDVPYGNDLLLHSGIHGRRFVLSRGIYRAFLADEYLEFRGQGGNRLSGEAYRAVTTGRGG